MTTGRPPPLHVVTPVVTSPVYATASGREVLFKMEALQPSGSFKMRGVGLLCQDAVDRGARSIVCPSGGNAGYAAAVAARRLGVRATVVVPQTTSKEAIAAIEALDASVVVYGEAFEDADVRARALAEEIRAAYVHPFDHPLLWTGHASLIAEVIAEDLAFDAVVLSVGGGGLLLGVLEGLRRNGLTDTTVYAVETEGAASLNAALDAGVPVSLGRIDTIATSLGARRVADAALAQSRTWPVRALLVTDRQALGACRAFADAFRVLVEPACGAAVAALTAHPEILKNHERVLVVACGGVGVSLARLAAWEDRLG